MDQELKTITVLGLEVVERLFEKTYQAHTNGEALEMTKKDNPNTKNLKAFGPDADKSKRDYRNQLTKEYINLFSNMEYSEFEKFVCDQYRDIFKNDYNEEYAKKSAQKIWDSVDDKATAMDAAKTVVETVRKEQESRTKTFDALSGIKDELFDAPCEIKNAFNSIIKYFDQNFYLQYEDNGKVKYYKIDARTRKEAQNIVDGWKRDYPDWTDYSKSKIVDHVSGPKWYALGVKSDTLSWSTLKSRMMDKGFAVSEDYFKDKGFEKVTVGDEVPGRGPNPDKVVVGIYPTQEEAAEAAKNWMWSHRNDF